MSVSQNYGNTKPSLLLDFANVKKLDPRISFSRASSAVSYDGKTVAKAEENLLLRSQEFDLWDKTNIAVTANNINAPDGTPTAEKIEDNATSGLHVVRSLTGTRIEPDVTFVFSVFLQKGTSDFAYILAADSTFGRRIAAVADLNTGTITQTNALAATLTSSSITSFGNDWYRVSIIGAITGQPATRFHIGPAPASSGNTFSGSGSSVGISYVGTGTDIYAWGAQVEQRSAVTAYTPTTTQPITNYIPVLQTASANTARFDHDPVTSESLGLLVEEQRTNLVTYSEQFDNAAWTKVNSTIESNVAVAPDGTLTGDRLIASTVANAHYVSRSFSGAVHTLSIYAKSNGYNLYLAYTIHGDGAVFNLSNGTISSFNTPSGTSITPIGNGWYRCSVSTTKTNHNGARIGSVNGTTVNDLIVAGDGYSGIYIWGAQLEAGAFPTSYIKTEASQVTRSADSASMTGSNFSSWYRQDEGTFCADAMPFSIAQFPYIFNAEQDISNTIQSIASDQFHARVFINGTAQANLDAGAFTNGVYGKLSLAYKTNDIAVAVDGGTVVTDSSCVLPTPNALFIGANSAAVRSVRLKKLAYYPARLTNEQLQALTS